MAHSLRPSTNTKINLTIAIVLQTIPEEQKASSCTGHMHKLRRVDHIRNTRQRCRNTLSWFGRCYNLYPKAEIARIVAVATARHVAAKRTSKAQPPGETTQQPQAFPRPRNHQYDPNNPKNPPHTQIDHPVAAENRENNGSRRSSGGKLTISAETRAPLRKPS